MRRVFSNPMHALRRRPLTPADAMLFSALLLVWSMPVSPFLMSIGMWGLVFTAFWHRATVPERPWTGAWGLLWFSFQDLFRQRAYAVLLLLLLVPALSGFWSEDQPYWLERTRVRLPFLVLPWAFANLPLLSGRQYRLVLYSLVAAMVLWCIGVGVNFLWHQEAILFDMYQGRPMPVPRHHIRFSLMVATATVAGGWLWWEGYYWRWPRERVFLGAGVLFLFGFMHVLSVRSGLAALYAALLFSLLRYLWRSRRWGLALVCLAGLLLLPWLAVRNLPSLRQKWEYTLYDWERFRHNEGETYSDAERWISLQTGYLIWRESPWLGAGAGDLPRETARVLKEQFPKYLPSPKLPHNQFLYTLAGTGLLGLLLSLIAFGYPVLAQQRYRFYLLGVFQVMIFTSFLVEYTIETAMGVAWYLFYTLWFLRLADAEKRPGKR